MQLFAPNGNISVGWAKQDAMKGIKSFGSSVFPSVFTKTSSFRSWLQKNYGGQRLS